MFGDSKSAYYMILVVVLIFGVYAFLDQGVLSRKQQAIMYDLQSKLEKQRKDFDLLWVNHQNLIKDREKLAPLLKKLAVLEDGMNRQKKVEDSLKNIVQKIEVLQNRMQGVLIYESKFEDLEKGMSKIRTLQKGTQKSWEKLATLEKNIQSLKQAYSQQRGLVDSLLKRLSRFEVSSVEERQKLWNEAKKLQKIQEKVRNQGSALSKEVQDMKKMVWDNQKQSQEAKEILAQGMEKWNKLKKDFSQMRKILQDLVDSSKKQGKYITHMQNLEKKINLQMEELEKKINTYGEKEGNIEKKLSQQKEEWNKTFQQAKQRWSQVARRMLHLEGLIKAMKKKGKKDKHQDKKLVDLEKTLKKLTKQMELTFKRLSELKKKDVVVEADIQNLAKEMDSLKKKFEKIEKVLGLGEMGPQPK